MGCVLCREAEAGGDGDRRKKPSSLAAATNKDVGGAEVPSRRSVCRGGPAALTPEPPRLGHLPCSVSSLLVAAPVAWPAWLTAAAGEALSEWTPRRPSSFQKLCKIGQGTYSNVYKARDLKTGKIVALKKVRFDTLEPESIKFMAKEITLVRRLDHPNVVKLEGLAISRVSSSLYLVFEYMEHDLTGLSTSPDIRFSVPQIKCYMKQLLAGLEHCHSRGVIHRDIKGSNLLIDNEGVLKIADFGLATSYDPENKQPMTDQVVTLWYRAPELLLGAVHYGPAIDLWSAGCILAELFARKPILPGRTEVEQLHKIFRLCGTPTEKYWKKSKLQHASMFKRQQPYKCCIAETFRNFPPCSVLLIETLLSIDPVDRGTATDALNSKFFGTEPHACEPASLPHYTPSKEMDAKLREEESGRILGKEKIAEVKRKSRSRRRGCRAIPAPDANAELQININRRRMLQSRTETSKSEKFPPPHKDGTTGTRSGVASDKNLSCFGTLGEACYASAIVESKEEVEVSSWQSLQSAASMGRKKSRRITPSQPMSSRSYRVPSVANIHIPKRTKGKESEDFGGGMSIKIL